MKQPVRTRPSTAMPAMAAVAVGLALILAGLATATAATVGQLQQRIGASRGRVSSLSGAVSASGARLDHLNASVSAVQARIGAVQSDLDRRLGRLRQLQSQLVTARTRLAQLEGYEAHAEQTLSRQLVASYESPPPNLVTVVLEATGFSQLLEELDFEQKIRSEDVAVVTRVRRARRRVAAEAVRFGALTVRAQALAAQVLHERNALADERIVLVRRQLAAARAHGFSVGKLTNARGELASLQGQLSRLRAAQAAAAARAARQAAARAQASTGSGAAGFGSAGSAGTGGSSAAPGSGSSSAGGFTFPLPKGSVVGPGSWSEDQGVDMAAPGDTPEYAVCSGTIVLHGIGGFGPWAPVLHCDAQVGGYSYVYYGHAGPLYQQPVGTHVSAGQTMSSIGPGIVGLSSGPHIELGFADSSGNPVGGSSASTMMSLLQASYAA